MAHDLLRNAKKSKNDEFYTQYEDIEKEVNEYYEYNKDIFKNKTILLPCDDPECQILLNILQQILIDLD